MSILTKPYMQTGNAHLLPIDRNDPTLALYLPLWYPHGDMTGSPIYSYDKNRHSCTVYGATWGSQGRTFAGADFINIDAALTPLAATTTGTWLSWVELDDATPTASSFLVCFGDTNADTTISMTILPSGVFWAQEIIGGINQWILVTDATILSDGVYGHVAVIQDGVSPVILINGVQIAQTFVISTDKTVWFACLNCG